jgi:hypothetical protein
MSQLRRALVANLTLTEADEAVPSTLPQEPVATIKATPLILVKLVTSSWLQATAAP